jgi:hypothetical protein
MIDTSLPNNFVYIRQYKGKKPIYDVEMPSITESRAIRDAFGMFWRKRNGRRLPEGLKGITIANCSTFATRVRVRLLKELSQRHAAANPSVTCFVTNYFARPELKLKDRKGPMVTLSYSKAVVKLSHHLTLEFLSEIYEYARTSIPEDEITERFLILSPDLLQKASGSANLSLMSVDEPVVQDVHGSTPPALDPPTSQSTPGNSDDFIITKKNKNRFFKKTAPYQKKN